MTGWLSLVGLAAASALGLWLWWGLSAAWARPPLLLAGGVGAALALAGAGYAGQGSPDMAGQPARPDPIADAPDPDFVAIRSALFGRYGTAGLYLTPSDALQRIGASGSAATLLQGGLNSEPNNVMLWTELGNVIAVHDRAVSPAALFAFRQGARRGPGDPGPWFFLGMAYLRGGEFEHARAAWAHALAMTPAGAGYRGDIARRLALLDQFIAAGG